jgi:hypothetical protein
MSLQQGLPMDRNIQQSLPPQDGAPQTNWHPEANAHASYQYPPSHLPSWQPQSEHPNNMYGSPSAERRADMPAMIPAPAQIASYPKPVEESLIDL